MQMNETNATTVKGAIGITATVGSFITSILPQVIAWLQATSLLLGCIVAIMTIVSLARQRKKGKDS